MSDTQAFFDAPPTQDYQFEDAPAVVQRQGEAGTLRFPSALVTPHAVNNTVYARWFPARRNGRSAPCDRPASREADPAAGRARHVTVERRPRRTRGPGPSARSLRHIRPSDEPSVPRPADARRTDTGRLHREFQHRANRSGVSTGGARCAARDRLARAPGVRAHRHPRHESRLVPRHADHGARTQNQGPSSQPHLPVVCGCGLEGAVDATRAQGAGRPRRTVPAQGALASDQSLSLPRPGPPCSNAAWSMRSTT